jgi:hypothetical protein
METVKVDAAKRVRLRAAKPGQVFAVETSGNVIRLTPVKPVDDDDVPIVKPIRHSDGTYSFPNNARPSREDIKRYIRVERDSR